MSESKWTPGPWDWFTSHDKHGNPIRSEADDKMRFLIGADGQGFAHTVGLPSETDLANARLIAAAPDLLDACRKALYLIKGREHVGFLRAAIAKAEGQS